MWVIEWTFFKDVCVGVVASAASDSALVWTVACWAPLSKTRILESVAMPSSRGSSQRRDQTSVSCIGRRVLYH